MKRTDTRLMAYFDTASGLIPCRIVEYGHDRYSGPVVTVRLTATRGAFKRGELITRPLSRIVGRTTRQHFPHTYVRTADHDAAKQALGVTQCR